jgi:Xaa-Pro dipeptidase
MINDEHVEAKAAVALPFERSEYERRLANVRDVMRERHVEVLLVVDPRNIYYLTGVNGQGYTHFQCLILLPSGDPRYMTWDFEAGKAAASSWLSNPDRIRWDYASGRLAQESWAVTVHTYSWHEDSLAYLVAALEDLGAADAQLAMDLRSFIMSAAIFERMRTALPRATFVDSFGLVEGSRRRKSEAELAYMRQAAIITDRAVDEGFAAAGVGVPDTHVAAAIMNSVYRDGSETIGWGPVVATGPNAGIGHASFTGRKLEPNDTVFLEFSASVHRYVAPVMRTAVLGAPTLEMTQIRDAGLRSLEAVMATARPDVPANQVARAGMAKLEPVSHRVHFHNLFGYSVGIGFPPSVFEPLGFELSLQNDGPLEVGMTFHVPISLRRFAEYGVSQSQTIVITDTGCEPLSLASAALRQILWSRIQV